MADEPDYRRIVQRGYDLVAHPYRPDVASGDGVYRDLLGWGGELLPDDRVLDLGCGAGVPVLRSLSERCRAVGVDISPVQLSRARELAPRADVVLGDMTTVAFPGGTFAGVFWLYSLIHVPVGLHQALIARIASWLRPGGFLVAVVGAESWTGTEDDWLGVPGAKMWWSHADAAAYRSWLGVVPTRVVDRNQSSA